jgi:hypothetical protein
VFKVKTLLPQGAETLANVGGVTSKILAVPGVKSNWYPLADDE